MTEFHMLHTYQGDLFTHS